VRLAAAGHAVRKDSSIDSRQHRWDTGADDVVKHADVWCIVVKYLVILVLGSESPRWRDDANDVCVDAVQAPGLSVTSGTLLFAVGAGAVKFLVAISRGSLVSNGSL
jgi:hypothetical protein